MIRDYYERTLRDHPCEELDSKSKQVEREAMMGHLKWMCREVLEGRVTGSRAERWTGYIQGELRAAGAFSIGQLRAQTRQRLGPEYVAGFLLHADLVALVRKAKPEWQRGKLNGVGGKVEEGETIWEAMQREFREEAGVEVVDWQHFATLYTKGTRVHFLRAAVDSRLDFSSPPEERVSWWPVTDLNDEVIPNLRWLVPMAISQRGIAEVWE